MDPRGVYHEQPPDTSKNMGSVRKARVCRTRSALPVSRGVWLFLGKPPILGTRNPKVGGSNPSRPTIHTKGLARSREPVSVANSTLAAGRKPPSPIFITGTSASVVDTRTFSLSLPDLLSCSSFVCRNAALCLFEGPRHNAAGTLDVRAVLVPEVVDHHLLLAGNAQDVERQKGHE